MRSADNISQPPASGIESGAAVAATERALGLIAERDFTVRGFAHLDPAVALADARRADAGRPGPLTGLTVGVKDIFDTHDAPTSYGSPIYEGFQPRVNASAVALIRNAGGSIVGKTVTAEFAFLGGGPTRNPHCLSRTPGGSSMGSAAAVASGMIDLGLATQTAGSTIRPASYCGVFGFKPSFGSVSTAGLKLLSPSLDTVAWLGRDVNHLDRMRVALTGRAAASPRSSAPSIAFARTEFWDQADHDSRSAVYDAFVSARTSGATGVPAGHVPLMRGLADGQRTVMQYEALRSLASELALYPSLLGDAVRDALDEAAAVDADSYDAALAHRNGCLARLDELFRDADVLLTPAVNGEAPAALGSDTGSPLFARQWTFLGLPSAVVPWSTGVERLPIGVQLVGRPGADNAVIQCAAWMARISPYLREGVVVPVSPQVDAQLSSDREELE